ncbi:hypothetical protein OW763_08820 [Clostridium aestuarii]|uniref:tRNA (Guanine-N1)-methyltransferase n=1 Tax=Clostridium aestuarii TaxID=338193 RepID=A0ABT4CZM4_9CLOT|nr:hypothetical protein [Clostridium aestuarii]MCY6484439.1 hypothetical protein [Clostridium aestuarii]
MSKPSIFSKGYDEKMRKRKKRRRILIVAVIIIGVTYVLLFNKNIGKNIAQGFKSEIEKISEKIIKLKNNEAPNSENEEKNINEEKESKLDNVKKEEVKGEIKEKVKQETMSIKLSNGEEINLIFIMNNGKKNYEDVNPKNIQYSISPSKNKVVLIEKNTQNMILIDEKGSKTDITKKQYISSKGTVFPKGDRLKINPNYIWNSYPKFLDDDNIIYFSQLPWFNKKEERFIWKYTISANKHEQYLESSSKEIFGKQIEYGNITKDGLEVIVDGQIKIIK